MPVSVSESIRRCYRACLHVHRVQLCNLYRVIVSCSGKTDAPVASDSNSCCCKTRAADFKRNVLHCLYIFLYKSCCYNEVKRPRRRCCSPGHTCRVIYTNVLAFISHAQSLPSLRASLWSSCVVLPLLALTWMSAVLAMTDKRSILFQILFAVFDSLQGFVIVMVHCILRREVEDDFT